MENTADGHSTLLEVREGAMDQSSAIQGVANLLCAANSEGNSQESHAELADSRENSEERNAEICGGLMNEFTENHLIFGGAFPLLFSLGVPEQFANGCLPTHLFKQLMLACIPDFERCHNFIFLGFNQMVRHAASRAVSFQALSSTTNFGQAQGIAAIARF